MGELELRVGTTYRAKRPRQHHTLAGTYNNDRTILWMNDSLVQYDGPAVADGRHYPSVTHEEFRKWASHEVLYEDGATSPYVVLVNALPTALSKLTGSDWRIEYENGASDRFEGARLIQKGGLTVYVDAGDDGASIKFSLRLRVFRLDGAPGDIVTPSVHAKLDWKANTTARMIKNVLVDPQIDVKGIPCLLLKTPCSTG